jgi:hypothetical protein
MTRPPPLDAAGSQPPSRSGAYQGVRIFSTVRRILAQVDAPGPSLPIVPTLTALVAWLTGSTQK